jgi:two-component sensor histidine kinase
LRAAFRPTGHLGCDNARREGILPYRPGKNNEAGAFGSCGNPPLTGAAGGSFSLEHSNLLVENAQGYSQHDETGGTGLGLTVARNLVRHHGGDISPENRPGGGLVVKVVLPVAGI